MGLSETDIAKIRFITVATQVNDIVVLLTAINKGSLIASIESTLPESKGSQMYQFLKHTLEFYNNVEEEISKQNNQDENDKQHEFKFE